MNAMLCRKLFVVAAAPMNSNLCWKLFFIHPFHFRNVFSTEVHSQTLFSQFASTKLNLSEVDISLMLKLRPKLQKLRTLHDVEKGIHLLKKYGLTEVQIAKILRIKPQLIGYAETLLEPKLRLLEDLGFVGRNLAKILTKCPLFLYIRPEIKILPMMEFLRNVFQSQDVFVKVLLRYPRLVGYSLEKTLKPSLAFWKGWGFSGTELLSFIQVHPGVLSCTSLTPGQVDFIHKIGVDKKSIRYKYIVSKVAVSRLETLEAKIENLKFCGLSAEEALQVFRTVPLVFDLSKENVSEKMNFIVNDMELPANIVLKHSNLFKINLEKTMRPRFLVWQKIKIINDFDLPFSRVMTMPESRFVGKIIKGHPESETLWTIYENAIASASNRTTALHKHGSWRRK